MGVTARPVPHQAALEEAKAVMAGEFTATATLPILRGKPVLMLPGIFLTIQALVWPVVAVAAALEVIGHQQGLVLAENPMVVPVVFMAVLAQPQLLRAANLVAAVAAAIAMIMEQAEVELYISAFIFKEV